MAKKKQLVKITTPSPHTYHFRAYVDNAAQWKKDVFSIEGVESVYVSKSSKSEISIYVDHRYDLIEVVNEVKALLLKGPPKNIQGNTIRKIWLKIKNFNFV